MRAIRREYWVDRQWLATTGPGGYRVPLRACRPRLATATVIHSRAPRSSGRCPALRSAATLVDRPIADSATATRNTEACCSGPCAPDGMTPAELTAAAITKPMRNQGTSLTTRRGDIRAGPADESGVTDGATWTWLVAARDRSAAGARSPCDFRPVIGGLKSHGDGAERDSGAGCG